MEAGTDSLMSVGLCWIRQDGHADGGWGGDDDDGGGGDAVDGGGDGDGQKGGKRERNSCSNTGRPKSQPRPGPISTLHTLTVSSGSRCL